MKFKKTTTEKSFRTPPSNSVNEQNNETARAKYNLVGFTAVLCKTPTGNEHFLSVFPIFLQTLSFTGFYPEDNHFSWITNEMLWETAGGKNRDSDIKENVEVDRSQGTRLTASPGRRYAGALRARGRGVAQRTPEEGAWSLK